LARGGRQSLSVVLQLIVETLNLSFEQAILMLVVFRGLCKLGDLGFEIF